MSAEFQLVQFLSPAIFLDDPGASLIVLESHRLDSFTSVAPDFLTNIQPAVDGVGDTQRHTAGAVFQASKIFRKCARFFQRSKGRKRIARSRRFAGVSDLIRCAFFAFSLSDVSHCLSIAEAAFLHQQFQDVVKYNTSCRDYRSQLRSASTCRLKYALSSAFLSILSRPSMGSMNQGSLRFPFASMSDERLIWRAVR